MTAAQPKTTVSANPTDASPKRWLEASQNVNPASTAVMRMETTIAFTLKSGTLKVESLFIDITTSGPYDELYS